MNYKYAENRLYEAQDAQYIYQRKLELLSIALTELNGGTTIDLPMNVVLEGQTIKSLLKG